VEDGRQRSKKHRFRWMLVWAPWSRSPNLHAANLIVQVADPQRGPTTRAGGRRVECPAVDGVIRLPGNDVRFFSPFFAKSFSSFVRTTCTLSVSELYLALAEIYLPISYCGPSQYYSIWECHQRRFRTATGVLPSLSRYRQQIRRQILQ